MPREGHDRVILLAIKAGDMKYLPSVHLQNSTMKFAIAFAVLIIAVSAAPQHKAKVSTDDVSVLSRSSSNDGSVYKFAFEQSDGQKRDEAGEVKLIGKEMGIVMRGSYSFVADDGQTYTVTYIADENGKKSLKLR